MSTEEIVDGSSNPTLFAVIIRVIVTAATLRGCKAERTGWVRRESPENRGGVIASSSH